MTAAGWVLVFHSGARLIIAALFVPIILGRIRAEERLLANAGPRLLADQARVHPSRFSSKLRTLPSRVGSWPTRRDQTPSVVIKKDLVAVQALYDLAKHLRARHCSLALPFLYRNEDCFCR